MNKVINALQGLDKIKMSRVIKGDGGEVNLSTDYNWAIMYFRKSENWPSWIPAWKTLKVSLDNCPFSNVTTPIERAIRKAIHRMAFNFCEAGNLNDARGPRNYIENIARGFQWKMKSTPIPFKDMSVGACFETGTDLSTGRIGRNNNVQTDKDTVKAVIESTIKRPIPNVTAEQFEKQNERVTALEAWRYQTFKI
jgi:hypothetical protein